MMTFFSLLHLWFDQRVAYINSYFVVNLRDENITNSVTTLTPYRWNKSFHNSVYPNIRIPLGWTTHKHMSNLFISVIRNVERTGRQIDEEDRKYLRYVLEWYAGWSATQEAHFDDPGFQFIRYQYASLELQPILDDMTYPEERLWMPDSRGELRMPGFFLFASPTRYYIFVWEFQALYDVGQSFKEVYEELVNLKYLCWFPNEKEIAPDVDLDHLDEWDYFPIYDGLKLYRPILPFIVPNKGE